MYKLPKMSASKFNINEGTENAERLETKVKRILTNKEPITDGAPIIHQTRVEGVLPSNDIRADRWDIALEATTASARAEVLQRGVKMDIVKEDDETSSGDTPNSNEVAK